MAIKLRDDRKDKKPKEKKIVLKATSKREEKAPKAYTFDYIRRKCMLRKKFLEEAIKTLEKEYPSIDFYQGFDWEQEGCPYIREEADHQRAFWEFMERSGYFAKGEMIEKQEMDIRQREAMQHEVLRRLGKPCGAVHILNLIYKKDPKKEWVSKEDKNWLKDILYNEKNKVYDILDNKCGDGPNKELARIYLSDSFGIAEEKNIKRIFKNREKVSIKTNRGWVTHYGFDGKGPKIPLRQKIRSSELADSGFFDKYERYDWRPDPTGQVGFFQKIPKGGRPKKDMKRKFELDEEPIMVIPKTLKIQPTSTPKSTIKKYQDELAELNESLKEPDDAKRITEKEYNERLKELDERYPEIKEDMLMMALGQKEMPKEETKPRRLKGQKGEFEASGGGQRDLFGGSTREELLDALRKRMRRR